MPLVRILIADDHAVVRNGLKYILQRSPDIQVVGEAADGREAIRLAAELMPDVILMDIAMPHLNGIEAADHILKRLPHTSIIILSMFSDESYILRALAAGVRGYILKDSVEDEIVEAV